MSSHRSHLVLAHWHSRLLGVWDRLGQLVRRTGRGEERLPVAVDSVSTDTDYQFGNWPDDFLTSHDVLRLLHRHAAGEACGSGPYCTKGVRAEPRPRTVSSTSLTGVHNFIEPSGYSPTLGGYAVKFGPYDAEDFAPAWLPRVDCE